MRKKEPSEGTRISGLISTNIMKRKREWWRERQRDNVSERDNKQWKLQAEDSNGLLSGEINL